MQHNERRHFPRFPFHSTAVLVCLPDYHDCTLIDISLRGALVALPAGCVVGAGRQCSLRVTGVGGRVAFQSEGHIVHGSPPMLGIEFCRADARAERGLRRLLEMNLAPRSLLEREVCALLQPARDGRRETVA